MQFVANKFLQNKVYILGIESSCDETAASICVDGKIVSNIIASQTVHEKYGGVVPELASRAHMQNIVTVVDEALMKANITLNQMNAVAFTQMPGLIGSLLVGCQFAKSISLALNIPLIAVNHLQAHVLANLIETPNINFPFLCLTVSGGHTQIIVCHSPLRTEVLGETLDDAAGEAFDKIAKILGLPYPGGQLIDKYGKLGNATKFSFPEPKVAGLNFSFSGLKTAVLYFLQNAGKSQIYHKESIATVEEQQQFIVENMNDICASVQERIVTILLNKLIKAVHETGIKTVCIAGGVSANSRLRSAFNTLGIKNKWQTHYPSLPFCTDNAAMIAITGYYKFLEKEFCTLSTPVLARSN